MDPTDVLIFIFTVVDVVLCRDCYNYKEEPEVRHCEQGCCGNKYEEYCCNVTLQIVGCVLGGVVVLSVLLAIVYYCYRKKSKGSQHGGLLARFGMRTNLTGVRPDHDGQRIQRHGHYIPPTRLNSSTRQAQSHMSHMNPAYMPHYPNSPNLGPGCLYPSAPMQAPVAPSAPMPPPYSIEPPPYVSTKELPPPPAYSTVVSHMRPGYKYDEYYGNMPPPSS